MKIPSPEGSSCTKKAKVSGWSNGEMVVLTRKLCGLKVEEVWTPASGDTRHAVFGFSNTHLSPPLELRILFRRHSDE